MPTLEVDVSHLIGTLGAEERISGEIALDPIRTQFRDLDFDRPAAYRFVLRNVGEGILARGDLEAHSKLSCSRCLKEFDYKAVAHLEELFSEGSGAKNPISEGRIELGPLAEQAVVLSVPVKTVCRSDCRGLCPVCGADRNRIKCDCRQPQSESPFAKLKDYFPER